MKIRWRSILLGGLISGAAVWPAAAQSVPTETERAGREAFIDLKCVACHRVLGDEGLPAPVADRPAPILGGLNAVHTVSELELAIASPSHSFAPGFKPSSAGASRMGDFLDTMTIEEMDAIVAYLKGQEGSTSGWHSAGK